VVAVAVIVRKDDGKLLMIQRSDNGLWAVPGGAQDIGETTRQAAIREVYEETGYERSRSPASVAFTRTRGM
jgi:8-oxo-dGTP pyrophosphatase MutT (NUDIX family)